MTFCHVSYPWMALVDPVGQRSVRHPQTPPPRWVRHQIALSEFLFHYFGSSPNIREVFCSLILRDFSFHLRVGAMASDNLEDVLTKSGVDSNLTNSLMMEGWTSQSFRMAAADAQGFEEVLQEWSSSQTLSTLQKACLRTAFQSLQPQQGPISSAFSTPTVSATTPAGSWAEAFPPKLEKPCCRR